MGRARKAGRNGDKQTPWTFFSEPSPSLPTLRVDININTMFSCRFATKYNPDPRQDPSDPAYDAFRLKTVRLKSNVDARQAFESIDVDGDGVIRQREFPYDHRTVSVRLQYRMCVKCVLSPQIG